MQRDLETRLSVVAQRGVVVVDPRQTYIEAEVQLDRLAAGAVLHPGTRLIGSKTMLGARAQVGPEGPATLVDTVLMDGARLDSGYAEGAVLLRDARAGANAHLRPGTLLEEQASTGHSVGLKQTVLGSFVTLGSLINFCDVLMTGGTSREDHSEVGSGFIHFNFTPWGSRGDKATPSLIGDAVLGVLLGQPRIFLGGAGGMVGPRVVGFGSVTAAGQVLRKDVADGRLVAQSTPDWDEKFQTGELARNQSRDHERVQKNVRYIAELVALRAWYREVRCARAPAEVRLVYERAIDVIEICIHERIKRLSDFLAERGIEPPSLIPEGADPPCPMLVTREQPYRDHVTWVKQLSDAEVQTLAQWLRTVSGRVISRNGLPAPIAISEGRAAVGTSLQRPFDGDAS